MIIITTLFTVPELYKNIKQLYAEKKRQEKEEKNLLTWILSLLGDEMSRIYYTEHHIRILSFFVTSPYKQISFHNGNFDR